MKNLKVSQKLLVTFAIVLLLAGAIGTVGLIGLNSMEHASMELYDTASPLAELLRSVEFFQRMRAYMWEVIIHTGESDVLARAEREVLEAHSQFESYMDAYYLSLRTDETKAMWNEIIDLFDNHIRPEHLEVIEAAKQGVPQSELMELIADADEDSDIVTEELYALFQARDVYMDGVNADNAALNNRMLFIIISVLVAAVGVAVFLGVYLSRAISNPLKVLRGYMTDAGDKGILEMTPEEKRLIPIYAEYKDEIGETIAAAQNFISHVTHIADELGKISNGDLTVDVEILSDEDVLGTSLLRVEDNLNEMFGSINASTVQVSTGAKQVADGAQVLAQGSTEQAASIEELSSSITEIATKTKENADMAQRAATLAGQIMQSAEKGNRQMDEMMNAVRDINQASQNISKVIKVIDDIAFQTNILALNAAVEAARAGQHGKGFAVVAEEVRSLAAKSADAAKETGEMIQNSIEKAELGSRIAGETEESLAEIVSGITESGALVGDIARSSEEQSAGISQINTGIDQVAQVIQQNSATAQESAAASEQMSAQSTMLQDLVAQFKLKDIDTGNLLSHPAPVKQLEAPKQTK